MCVEVPLQFVKYIALQKDVEGCSKNNIKAMDVEMKEASVELYQATEITATIYDVYFVNSTSHPS